MTFCTSGLLGIGTYFAVNALYSCRYYSFQLSNGKCQVFLAKVLTGESTAYKDENDRSLFQSSKKNEDILGARYSSV